MPEHAKSPYRSRYALVTKVPYAFAAPYGSTGAKGVRSLCGASAGCPKTHAEEAWKNRGSPALARSASSSLHTATVPTSAVWIGWLHASGPNETEARL